MKTKRCPTPRRSFLLVAAALGFAAGTATGRLGAGRMADPPVTLVVGFPPGGQTDFAARVLLSGMQKRLGQPVDHRQQGRRQRQHRGAQK
jgi:tripartite-type tricarboxylate transporter receptor subunit TctC